MEKILTFKKVAFTSMLLTGLNLSAQAYEAPFTSQAPVIDGVADESIWASAEWEAIDQLTLGSPPSTEDFSGRFKVVWSHEKLYLLAEIVDDIIIDTHPDPLEKYWDDDTLEVFLDEDHSGGDHLDNYNAFAYHIALDNQVVDYNLESKPRLLNDHVISNWKRSTQSDKRIIWEASFDVYPDTFKDSNNDAKPVKLVAGKKIGFMVAYCDADGTGGRQHFVGSHEIAPVNGDRNRGYIDASVFDTLTLIGGTP